MHSVCTCMLDHITYYFNSIQLTFTLISKMLHNCLVSLVELHAVHSTGNDAKNYNEIKVLFN